MDYFTIKNWDKFQHYKDRMPPWIKLHRELLNNYEFTRLQDASKLHLMLLWLLASQTDNKLPVDPEWLKNALHIDTSPDLEALFNAGFIEIDSALLADCKQVDIVETEAEAYKQETDKTPTSKPKSRFDDWWEAWPKKVDKANAAKKWKTNKCDDMADALIADVEIRKARHWDWIKDEGKYIPNPTTYINGKRWQDEIIGRPRGNQNGNGQNR